MKLLLSRTKPIVTDRREAIDALVEAAQRGAARSIEQYGISLHTAILLLPDLGCDYVAMPPGDDDEVAAFDAFVRDRAQMLAAEAVCVVVETWHAKAKRGDKRRPQDRPDREESVFCFLSLPARSVTWRAAISRDADGKPSLGSWAPEDAVFVGRFTDIIRKNAPEA